VPTPSQYHRPPPRSPGAGSMPSLARFHDAGETADRYVISDPTAPRRRRRTRPARSIGFRDVLVGMASLGTVIGCALWAASHAGSLLGGLLLSLLGGAVGALLGGMLAVALGNLPRSRLHRDPDDGVPKRVVRPADERAWRLCEIGAALAGSTSWADRIVDPGRRVPAILWSAVVRALVIDRQYADAQRAVAHTSLADLARETMARVAEERAALDAVEANLRAVLAAATGIDQLERDRRAAAARRWEEHELRTRLTGQYAAFDHLESHDQADRSAGLAAEAEVVAELLAESDAMLRDLD